MSKPIVKKKTGAVAAGPAQPVTGKIEKNLNQSATEMLFKKDNFLWMGIGFALIVVGMLLMIGGKMPDANTWDADLIYGTRRTLLAPVVILAGLVVEIYAIFKR